ncbi:uroporphyrinogen-III synthase [Neobacillus terrae]|uniref:uroporphyrinogen-III synthase n=1 Tax=Neobacillus terrae TaxID=3034837 RepID=UPI00140C30D6|nr:uroporphyrinogen-III synthase [Neobacillus terrae]NHM30497.1 uroporphyrinogen-III synthase [Neobacillus terrae]
MIKPSPLLDKKVLVPRGKKQAKSFSQLVETFGGIPIEIPLIAFRPIQPNDELAAIFNNIKSYSWIIFTSNTTVDTFFSFLSKDEISHLPKIAVIGERTQKVVKEKGVEVSFLPSGYVAETFAKEFVSFIKEGDKIFIPKGNLARDVIAEELRRFGTIVDEAIVYETYLPEESRLKLADLLKRNELDILMFTSPSTVDHFMAVVEENHLRDQIKECMVACIGPVTKEKLKSYGLLVHASPKVYTVEAMIKSMAEYIN